MSLAELRKVDTEPGEPIPTLDEVLSFLANHHKTDSKSRIFIDIKNWDKSAVEAIVGIIEKYCKDAIYAYEQLPVTGMSWELLRLAKNLNPRISTGQSLIPLKLPASAILKLAKYSSSEMVNMHHRFLSPKLVARVHQAGLAVNAWAVNDKSDMRRMLAAEVDAIMTDRPKLLNRIMSDAG